MSKIDYQYVIAYIYQKHNLGMIFSNYTYQYASYQVISSTQF